MFRAQTRGYKASSVIHDDSAFAYDRPLWNLADSGEPRSGGGQGVGLTGVVSAGDAVLLVYRNGRCYSDGGGAARRHDTSTEAVASAEHDYEAGRDGATSSL
ncbi:hypothetical protein HGRIS_011884 [Hohenbuehelia grisea]|uniref:Uncharacterized protein n=1 Tax=Hohenbuehelia grisea TaxID=104357 RepID=A0ABR3JWL9_9AGAR